MAAWMSMCCCNALCSGCVDVARDLGWGGSRSTKPSFFPCQMASAGDERYLVCVCAAVAAAAVPSIVGASSVFCNEWLFMHA